jgi:hypothetical protein
MLKAGLYAAVAAIGGEEQIEKHLQTRMPAMKATSRAIKDAAEE